MTSPLTRARYLAAKGRRDEAIALLVANDEIRELDTLDADDALAQIGGATRRPYSLARALARRRRFDVLRPLLRITPSTILKHRFDAPSVAGALAGLWEAPATADDSMLVRDWLVPATTADGNTAWYERAVCAELLALLGDTAMARVITDELRAAIAATTQEVVHIELFSYVAPALHALGERDEAKRVLDAAQELFDRNYGDDVDNYGYPFQDAILHAQAVIPHLERLVDHRYLPWRPQYIVSSMFTNVWVGSRYGTNRAARERWQSEALYHLQCEDLRGALDVFFIALVEDPDYAPGLLASIADAVSRRAEVGALAAAAHAVTNPRAIVSVVLALVESGWPALASEQLARVDHPNERARLGPWLDELTADR